MGKIYNVNELTEVKKNQTGTGLLIENDGHIFGNSDTINQIKEDIDNGHSFVCPDHFVVSAVFQKYGIKNANGRIYPENVLKREVQKYLETKVANRCALGALDHPSCQLADTQILTENDGWKMIQDVKLGDTVFTVTSDKKIEVKPVLRKIEEPYKGKMIHFKGHFIDITVTPNHKFPLLNRDKSWKGFYTAQEIFDNKVPDQKHSYFFKTGEWNNKSDSEFIIDALSESELNGLNNTLKNVYSKELHIPMDIWMKFFGIYLSEGDSCYLQPNGKRCGKVSIHQKKQEICEEIEGMLEEFPLQYYKYEHKNGSKTYCIFDLRLSKFLSQFGKCYDKYVPYEIKNQGKDMLRIFYDWFVMCDGRKRGIKPGNYYSDDVFSTSKRLVMDLNEIQFKIGFTGSYHEEDRHYDRMIEGRTIKAENSHNMYFSMRSHNECIVLNPKSLTITEEDYDGMVYCIEVENHTFYTMCPNGKCLWSGNSSSLSGHDVAHNILDLRWQGQTLIGEMELHLSPGYKKYGVCSTSGDMVANMLLSNYLIGVSSRGVGSVKQVPGGILMVDDDFEILCWDVVIENSTPGAVIRSTPEELKPFIENEIKNGNLVNEKINKIKEILNS